VEDDSDTANLFSHLFEAKGYRVTIARTAEECLKIYSKSLQKLKLKHTPRGTLSYDAIILDYNLPDRNGLEVAKEILAISPHQRIIFVSAYIEDTLSYSIKELNIPVEVLQKPVSNDVLMNTIEDKEIYDELKRLGLNPEEFKKAGFNHEVLRKILDIFKESKSFVIFCFLAVSIMAINNVLQ
jgi:CheY-like chemotaxis protein